MSGVYLPPGYRPEDPPTLFIDRSSSVCGACGEAASPEEEEHLTVPPGMSRRPSTKGCGVRWTHLSSNYYSLRAAATEMRPDLIWSGPDA